WLRARQFRLIPIRQTQDPGAQGVDAEIEQTIIAAEIRQVVDAPQLVVVAAGAGGKNIGDVEQSQWGSILKQQRQDVAPLQELPIVKTVVPEAAVVRVADIQGRRIAGDLEGVTGR